MKSLVACLLVLATFAMGVGQRQNPRRSQNNRAPATQTIRICQGVPIPDGYVIVAYLTSAACPHGSYVLKRVNSYESSLGANRNSADPKTSSTAASDPEKQPSPARTSTDKGPRSSAKRSTSPAPSKSSPPPSANSSTPGRGAAAASRPRVVGNRQTQDQPANVLVSTPQSQDEKTAPPTLTGSEPSRPSGPPTLAQAGSQPQTSTDANLNEPTGEPTVEELSEGDVLRVDTTLVTVPVSVLDRQGRFIPNLKREDFTLLENGNEQSIAFFETAEKPFTVALLLDTSASTQFKLSEIKAAALEFAKQLRPQDRVLVVTFNSEVLLLTEPTNDLGLMEETIEEFAHTGTATRLYDAVNLTIDERLNRIKGRKAIVLFTDGVDTASQQASYQSTLEQVEELDALIYPVQYDTSDYMRAMQGSGQGTVTVTTTRRGIFGSSSSTQTYNAPANSGAPMPGTTKEDYDRANVYLHALADKTGGRLYQANNTRQLADAFTRIAEELRRQYTIGYYPKTATGADGERRAIRVRVRQPHLAVKARNSYVTSSPSQNK
ncbi:MAG: VWA domain-containing protein [Acidobacteriota bacterium]